MGDDVAIGSLKDRINHLNQEAWSLRVHDSQKSLELSRKAVELAKGINYTKGLAEGLRAFGFCNMRLSNHDKAYPLLKESLSLFETLNDRAGQSEVTEILGVLERVWGNLANSLQLLLRALDLATEIGHEEDIATSNYQLGVTYKHLGDYENALDHFYKSIALTKKLGNALYESYSINLIGSVYFETGEYQKALEYYLQGLPIRRAAGDKWGEAGSLDNIGFTYLKLKDYQQATEYCKRSLEITRSTGDKKGQANTLLHLAEISRESKDLNQAEEFFNESLQLWRTMGDKRGEAEVLLLLAGLHKASAKKKNQHEFLQWLSGALTIAEEIKALDLQSRARRSLYEFYTQTGNFKEAITQLELHISLEKELHKNAINQKVLNLEISHKAEEIKKEAETERLRNKELLELNEQIEKANAELRIEASLERVRAVAMGMKEPGDMINVCRMISQELQQLGFKEIRNVQTVIIYPQKHEYLNYQYFAPYDKESIEIIDYRLHPDVLEFSNQMLSSPDAYYTKSFEGEELKLWREYRKQTNQLPDPKLDVATSSHYYFYSIGSGALGVTTYAPLNEEQIDLFKRFRNVFELAYKRFIDIEKALAQAKEAQTEAGLERIRARAMAMHSSDELIEVANILREQMGLLDQPELETSVVSIVDENLGVINNWNAYREPGLSSGKITTSASSFPINSSELTREMMAHYHSGQKEFTLSATGAKLHEFFQVLMKADPQVTNYSGTNIPEKIYYHFTSFTGGTLLTVSYQPPTEDIKSLQRRAASVFDMAYRRYLDLKKAEEQAREARIEASLERVRSRTMAMHHSKELNEAAELLYSELTKLGIVKFTCGYVLIDPKTDTGYSYMANPEGSFVFEPLEISQTESPVFRSFYDSWKKQEPFNTIELKGQDNIDHNRYLAEKVENFPFTTEQILSILPPQTISNTFNFKHGYLIVVSLTRFTPEQYDLMLRFTKVFEQTYTRFLDLQKAEAQTREAQIEAALEKVRSRSLAMHKSDELKDVIHSVFEKLNDLNFELDTAIIIIFKEGSKDTVWWLENRKDQQHLGVAVNYTDISYFRNLFDARKNGKELISNFYDLKEKNELLSYLFDNTDFRYTPEEQKEFLLRQECATMSVAIAKNTGIHITRYAEILFSEAQNDILKKFSKVFDQAYTRFLDLQKAEAQAKEAQIQLALERVRARTMAMQKSDELQETNTIMFQQIESLGIPLIGDGIHVCHADEPFSDAWMSDPLKGQMPRIRYDHTQDKVSRKMYDGWKNGESFLEVKVQGEELKEHFEYVLPLIQNRNDYKEIVSDHTIFHFAYYSYGLLVFVTREQCPQDHSIFTRFAKVFEQTYTRFLDLQKAEAQAREAQIETALEKVRSHTMGMRSSDDLAGVAAVMFDQMRILGGDLFSFGIVLCDKHENLVEQWHGIPHAGMMDPFFVPVDLDYIHRYRYDQWKSGAELFSIIIPEDYIAHHFELMLDLPSVRAVWEGIAAKGIPLPPIPTWEIDYGASFNHGYLLVSALKPFKEEKIFPRFAKVFEQAYTRFLDLQKAEAQTREAQIEAALERVRAKVMAMTTSKDLNETSLVFGDQLRKLGIDWQFSYFWLIEKVKNENTFWITWPDKKTSITVYTLEEAEQYFNECLISWRAGIKIHDSYVSPAEVQAWLDTFQRITDDAGGVAKQIMTFQTFNNGVFYYDAMMKYGSFGICINKPATEEEKTIQCRFAVEFERAYTRFLDLKKAEGQAREAQIEVAVERVRAKALAMHKSEDLHSAVVTLKKELHGLQIPGVTAATIYLQQDDGSIRILDLSTAREDEEDKFELTLDKVFRIEDTDPDLWVRRIWYGSENYFVVEADEADFGRVVAWLYTIDKESAVIAESIIKEKSIKKAWLPTVKLEKGKMNIDLLEPPVAEIESILLKMGAGFDLAYKRFLDLQKAEAQTREAQIEATLERVRSRSMAMHKSDELLEVVASVFQQMQLLGFNLNLCNIVLFDATTLGADYWVSGREQAVLPEGYHVPYADHPFYHYQLTTWKNAEPFAVFELGGEIKKSWDEILFTKTDLKRLPDPTKKMMQQLDKVTISSVATKHGLVQAIGTGQLSNDDASILSRFAKVFEQTYTRFLDLQKAEAQAREAQIEAALERVRARAMAMHSSTELKEVAKELRKQIGLLDTRELVTCAINLYEESAENVYAWAATRPPESHDEIIEFDFSFPKKGIEIIEEVLHVYSSGAEEYVVINEGAKGTQWMNVLKDARPDIFSILSYSKNNRTTDIRVWWSCAFFPGGSLIMITKSTPEEASRSLLKRFAQVFGLAYRRFADLRRAEAQAREATIEVALERVRARALAMQEPEELKDVAQVLRNEMGALGVEELETSSIYIHGESSEDVECWYALQDPKHTEKKMISDHFVLNLNDTWVGREMKKFYRSDEKQTSVVMRGENRKEWISYCYQHSPVFTGFYGDTIPDRTYHLYKFSHGYIGAAAPGDISAESWKLLSRAASVFSLAYSRFKDLTQARIDLVKLKEEKKRAENALSELQNTQKQLIQTEKMASLGELTAGIAHEIQNPLNFVNNFSDVSNELIEEMKTELATGNAQQAIQIANGVQENLEKILHHGKRADAIVKSMLLHSRSSTGKKEPTAINSLCDEYIRLAYHGLRAKDKSFNAKFETDLDKSIDKINIVPQEIGRVILNLINNAFYAVNERKKSAGNGYEPVVTISTKYLKPSSEDLGVVEIKVKDNGEGIPQKVLDKIFQPFFTTKPTGHGTGLGLSLSYDIVTKGHGGEIKVETKEGAGSEFIISLPVI